MYSITSSERGTADFAPGASLPSDDGAKGAAVAAEASNYVAADSVMQESSALRKPLSPDAIKSEPPAALGTITGAGVGAANALPFTQPGPLPSATIAVGATAVAAGSAAGAGSPPPVSSVDTSAALTALYSKPRSAGSSSGGIEPADSRFKPPSAGVKSSLRTVSAGALATSGVQHGGLSDRSFWQRITASAHRGTRQALAHPSASNTQSANTSVMPQPLLSALSALPIDAQLAYASALHSDQASLASVLPALHREAQLRIVLSLPLESLLALPEAVTVPVLTAMPIELLLKLPRADILRLPPPVHAHIIRQAPFIDISRHFPSLAAEKASDGASCNFSCAATTNNSASDLTASLGPLEWSHSSSRGIAKALPQSSVALNGAGAGSSSSSSSSAAGEIVLDPASSSSVPSASSIAPLRHSEQELWVMAELHALAVHNDPSYERTAAVFAQLKAQQEAEGARWSECVRQRMAGMPIAAATALSSSSSAAATSSASHEMAVDSDHVAASTSAAAAALSIPPPLEPSLRSLLFQSASSSGGSGMSLLQSLLSSSQSSSHVAAGASAADVLSSLLSASLDVSVSDVTAALTAGTAPSAATVSTAVRLVLQQLSAYFELDRATKATGQQRNGASVGALGASLTGGFDVVISDNLATASSLATNSSPPPLVGGDDSDDDSVLLDDYLESAVSSEVSSASATGSGSTRELMAALNRFLSALLEYNSLVAANSTAFDAPSAAATWATGGGGARLGPLDRAYLIQEAVRAAYGSSRGAAAAPPSADSSVSASSGAGRIRPSASSASSEGNSSTSGGDASGVSGGSFWDAYLDRTRLNQLESQLTAHQQAVASNQSGKSAHKGSAGSGISNKGAAATELEVKGSIIKRRMLQPSGALGPVRQLYRFIHPATDRTHYIKRAQGFPSAMSLIEAAQAYCRNTASDVNSASGDDECVPVGFLLVSASEFVRDSEARASALAAVSGGDFDDDDASRKRQRPAMGAGGDAGSDTGAEDGGTDSETAGGSPGGKRRTRRRGRAVLLDSDTAYGSELDELLPEPAEAGARRRSAAASSSSFPSSSRPATAFPFPSPAGGSSGGNGTFEGPDQSWQPPGQRKQPPPPPPQRTRLTGQAQAAKAAAADESSSSDPVADAAAAQEHYILTVERAYLANLTQPARTKALQQALSPSALSPVELLRQLAANSGVPAVEPDPVVAPPAADGTSDTAASSGSADAAAVTNAPAGSPSGTVAISASDGAAASVAQPHPPRPSPAAVKTTLVTISPPLAPGKLSRYRGVTRRTKDAASGSQKWQGQVVVANRPVQLGSYRTQSEAAWMFDCAAVRLALLGQIRATNFPTYLTSLLARQRAEAELAATLEKTGTPLPLRWLRITDEDVARARAGELPPVLTRRPGTAAGDDSSGGGGSGGGGTAFGGSGRARAAAPGGNCGPASKAQPPPPLVVSTIEANSIEDLWSNPPDPSAAITRAAAAPVAAVPVAPASDASLFAQQATPAHEQAVATAETAPSSSSSSDGGTPAPSPPSAVASLPTADAMAPLSDTNTAAIVEPVASTSASSPSSAPALNSAPGAPQAVVAAVSAVADTTAAPTAYIVLAETASAPSGNEATTTASSAAFSSASPGPSTAFSSEDAQQPPLLSSAPSASAAASASPSATSAALVTPPLWVSDVAEKAFQRLVEEARKAEDMADYAGEGDGERDWVCVRQRKPMNFSD